MRAFFHHHNSPAHRRGDTLLEMIATIFIVIIIVGVLAEMFIVLLRTHTTYDTQAQLVQSASTMLQRFSSYANHAYAIEANRTVGGTTYTTGQGTVVFRLASIDAAGNPIAATYDYLIITTDPVTTTKLIEITDADPTSARPDQNKTLGEHVGEYLFAYRNADPVTSNDIFFMVTVTKSLGRTSITHTLHTYAKLRNVP